MSRTGGTALVHGEAGVRIHFTRADLARTHLAHGADVMWEVINSLQALQGTYGRNALTGWRRAVRHALHHDGLARPVRQRLFPLAPDAAYYPDLLTPPEGTLGLNEAVEVILSTPRRRLRTEFALLAGHAGAGAWLVDLGMGRTAALRELGDLLHAYHRLSIAPIWSVIRACADSDLALRWQTLLDGGVDALLGGFHPMMRWQPPVLHVLSHPSDREIHLGGRGLTLIPSYFCRKHPVTIFDSALPQVVVYPMSHTPGPSHRGPGLERLLGETRAAVLRAVGGGGTTGKLAKRVGVSPATISHHTAILRDAGLVITRREAATAVHTLTLLGLALLPSQEVSRARCT
ncbi:ArsR/SmtB family transcription factor [Nonomuraea fuscirosea]|uniref:ArsR/SmtB family transcription factor n=1 Tax=Nonomuraea fuscirosea TaxID=1291556 RepID=UPI000D059899|nr:winged helix-turn-helix domain-containing protein [Nonomuraea fuscirosea]